MRFRQKMYIDEPETEVSDGTSITVPDQTLTVHEIMRRHTMQLPVPQRQNINDTIFENLPENLETMSKVELQQARIKAAAKVTETHRKLQAIAAAKEKAERELNKSFNVNTNINNETQE